MTIFLDADDRHWIIAQDRQELMQTLLTHIHITNDDDLLRLAAACLNCDEEAVMFTEQ